MLGLQTWFVNPNPTGQRRGNGIRELKAGKGQAGMGLENLNQEKGKQEWDQRAQTTKKGKQEWGHSTQTRKKGKQQHFWGYFCLFRCLKNCLGVKFPQIHFASPRSEGEPSGEVELC